MGERPRDRRQSSEQQLEHALGIASHDEKRQQGSQKMTKAATLRMTNTSVCGPSTPIACASSASIWR
jgi:hypothetical protein